MQEYCVNKNSQIKSGIHKIHTQKCPYAPDEDNRQKLGFFANDLVVMSEAAKYYSCVGGCFYCCKDIYLKNKTRK